MKERYFDPKLKIFSLSSNRPLAEKIAALVGVELGKLSVDRFSDGEIQINIEESIRGDNVYVIQSTSAPVNDNLMELLILVEPCAGPALTRSTWCSRTTVTHVKTARPAPVNQSRPSWWPTCSKIPGLTGWWHSTCTRPRSKGSLTSPSTT